MDGLKQTYKQVQSFGLSTNPLSGNLPNRHLFPRYDANGPFNIMGGYKLNHNYQSDTIATIGSVAGGAVDKYTGFTNTPDGILYSFPSTSVTSILKVDTRIDTVTQVGNLGSGKYQSTILYKNFIYAVPTTINFPIIKLNILNDATYTLMTSVNIANGWIGMVLAPNGKIFCIPFDSTQILVIDPEFDTVEYVGNLTGTAKWVGGCLVGDFIYCAPYNSNRILKINTIDYSYELVGSLSGTANYFGCYLAKNRKVYFIPHSATTVMVLDPSNDSTYTFGSLTGATKWVFGCPSSNESFIYGVPYSSDTILKIDTETDTTTRFGSLAGSSRYAGGCLAQNGCLYFAPRAASTVLKLLDPLKGNLDSDFVLNRYIAHE